MKHVRVLLVFAACVALAMAASPALGAQPKNDDVGLFDPDQGRWHLIESDGSTNSFYFGNPSDTPFMGDWDGDGIDTPGLYRVSDGFVYLRNSNTQGTADVTFFFGNPGDVPIAGDFDGDGFDSVSLFRPGTQTFYIINELGEDGGGLGAAETDFSFGNPGDTPIAGDWDGDGTDTIGVYRPSTSEVLQRNSNTAGPADTTFVYGEPGDAFVPGDWDGNPTTDTPGVFRSPDAKFYLRNANSTGVATESFFFGEAGWIPVAGRRAPLPPIQLQILAINDFHGHIATTNSAFGGVGRADYLAANIRAAEAGVNNSIVVSAGDLIGASPLVSALFHDEPTIEAMNLIGLDINGVGNHEFDEGSLELLRMQNGGSHPDGDLDGDGFAGADFDFLAANVVVKATGETVFPAYTVKEYEGVKVAFIGMTLEGTPTIVTQAGVEGLVFKDEVETVNKIVPMLQAQGIEAIVVLMHEGGVASEGGGDGDGCGTLSGPLNDIVLGLDDAVDLVIGGHNNERFACMDVGGKAVTMAYYQGRMYTDIDVTLDRYTGDMNVQSIDNVPNAQEGVTPAPDVTSLIDRYLMLSAPLSNQLVGTITADLLRTKNDAGESPLGDRIADAQLAATAGPTTGNAVVAFMNPGGIRADITYAQSGTEGDGNVTYGEAFTTQPFGNSLVTMTLTGAQIDTLLEQQWLGQTSPRILEVSEGFSYTWDANAADGSKVDPTTIEIDGVAVEPGTEYRVTVNSFLADGGDNFTILIQGTNRLGGEVDLDALITYFGDNPGLTPGPQDRITRLN